MVGRVRIFQRQSPHTNNDCHSLDLKLKDVAKAMGKLFASGASVSDTASGGKEIVIQGDVLEAVAAMLEEKYDVRMCVFRAHPRG